MTISELVLILRADPERTRLGEVSEIGYDTSTVVQLLDYYDACAEIEENIAALELSLGIV